MGPLFLIALAILGHDAQFVVGEENPKELITVDCPSHSSSLKTILKNSEGCRDAGYTALEVIVSVRETVDYLAEKSKVIHDCSELPFGFAPGIYELYPHFGSHPTQAFCDQDTDGGGWTVILNRGPQINRLEFNRTFGEYKRGFGKLSGEFWLGLEVIHQLTNNDKYQLRIDLMNHNNETATMLYNDFYLSGESDGYRLHFSSSEGHELYSKFDWHNGKPFSTYDLDRDENPHGGNCAQWFGGGWWHYDTCYQMLLTMDFTETSEHYQRYGHVSGGEHFKYLKKASMKIRPLQKNNVVVF